MAGRPGAAAFGHDLVRGPDGQLVACFASQLGVHVLQEEGALFAIDEIANGVGLWCRVAVGPDHALHVMYQGDGGLTYAR